VPLGVEPEGLATRQVHVVGCKVDALLVIRCQIISAAAFNLLATGTSYGSTREHKYTNDRYDLWENVKASTQNCTYIVGKPKLQISQID
jgi:hypothetical protein